MFRIPLGTNLKAFSPFFLLLIGCILLSGCASSRPYFMDRARDAGDVVTLTVGYGWGVKARIASVQSGLLYNFDYWGWRHGFYNKGSGSEYGFLDWSILFFSGENFFKHPDPRGKGFGADGLLFLTVIRDKHLPRSPLFHPYYSQIEVCAALWRSMRIGVNPGEFADFLLGWVGVDFFDDDIGIPREDSSPADQNKSQDEINKDTTSKPEERAPHE